MQELVDEERSRVAVCVCVCVCVLGAGVWGLATQHGSGGRGEMEGCDLLGINRSVSLFCPPLAFFYRKWREETAAMLNETKATLESHRMIYSDNMNQTTAMSAPVSGCV